LSVCGPRQQSLNAPIINSRWDYIKRIPDFSCCQFLCDVMFKTSDFYWWIILPKYLSVCYKSSLLFYISTTSIKTVWNQWGATYACTLYYFVFETMVSFEYIFVQLWYPTIDLKQKTPVYFFRNIFSRVPRIILSTINSLKLLWINVYVWKIQGNEKEPCCFHMKRMCYFWITNRIVLSHICITSTCQRKRYKLKMAKFYVWFIEIKRIFLNIMTSKKATLGRYRSRYVIICNSFLVFLSKKK
jgi:hypothetical protein